MAASVMQMNFYNVHKDDSESLPKGCFEGRDPNENVSMGSRAIYANFDAKYISIIPDTRKVCQRMATFDVNDKAKADHIMYEAADINATDGTLVPETFEPGACVNLI